MSYPKPTSSLFYLNFEHEEEKYNETTFFNSANMDNQQNLISEARKIKLIFAINFFLINVTCFRY